MDPKDKELVLKDLSARVPYKPKLWTKCIPDRINYQNKLNGVKDGMVIIDGAPYDIEGPNFMNNEQVIKAYLRPISSMTDEEIDKLFEILDIDKEGSDSDWIKINDALGIEFFFTNGKYIEDVVKAIDYLNSIHVDYRGLLPMKLAEELVKV